MSPDRSSVPTGAGASLLRRSERLSNGRSWCGWTDGPGVRFEALREAYRYSLGGTLSHFKVLSAYMSQWNCAPAANTLGGMVAVWVALDPGSIVYV